MTSAIDDRIMALYRLAQQGDAAGISDDQIQAVEELKKLSVRGNPDATVILARLMRSPCIHPFLREVLAS